MYKVKSYEIALQTNFRERYEIRDPFENVLEQLVKREIEFADAFYRNSHSLLTQESKQTHHNKKSGAKVMYVSPQELPQSMNGKVLGLYNSQTHTILIADNLSPKEEKFVYFHEEAHSIGIINERLADEYAASKSGYTIHRNYYSLSA